MATNRSGESYLRDDYPEIIREDILDKYKRKKADPKAVEKEIALTTYAVRAALFLLDGPENGMKFVKDPGEKEKKSAPKKADDELRIRIDDILEEDLQEQAPRKGRLISYDRVMEVAQELVKNGILKAAEQDYSYLFKDERKRKTDPVKIIPQEEMQYEGFLYKAIDKMKIAEDIDADLRKTQAKNAMLTRAMTYREHWDYKCPDRGIFQDMEPYRNDNKSVYEYEAPESTWQLFSAMSHVMSGDGGKQMTYEETQRVKSLAIPKMILRNKQTEEKLKRGDSEGVVNAYTQTLKSFTFRSEEELKDMQQQAALLETEMNRMKGKATNSQEWRDLRYALQKFSKAGSTQDAAKRSADVLLAVENFTKGKKSKQDAETQPLVDTSLRALAMCVPDASHNASVKPLIDRFNQVRSWHIGQKRVELEDFGTSSELSAEKKVQKKAADAEEEIDDPLNTGFIDYGKKAKEPNLFS